MVPAALTIVPISEPRELFRVVRTGDRNDPELVESFKSNYELGKPIRPRSPEATYRAIWQAVSMFETLEAAKSVACRVPALGGWVARLVLDAEHSCSLAVWGSRHHVSVWGDPCQMSSAVADIFVVEVAT